MKDEILQIIRKSREITLPFYGKAEAIAQKDESPHNIVTQLDNDVEQYLKTEFAKVDPTIGFAGEEFGGSRDSERFWLVDPIDGTLHFTRGIPFCTTMVALIEKGQVTFSAIYDFVTDTMYHAERGKGAFKNGERIYVSDRPVTNSVVGFETQLANPENALVRDKVRARCLLIGTIVAGSEFVLVATGKIEARVCYNPFGKDYDYAAGTLLVEEAGGIVKNLGSDTYHFSNTNLFAGNKHLYENFTQGDNAIFPIK